MWASLSDQIGRRKTFMIFTLASIPLYLSIPTFISMVVENGQTVPIYGFIGSSVLCISMMGGTYAILPAYEADLYGSKVRHVMRTIVLYLFWLLVFCMLLVEYMLIIVCF